jgi:hypothetical protein
MYSDILGWRENKRGRRGGEKEGEGERGKGERRGGGSTGGGNRSKCLSTSINKYKQTSSEKVKSRGSWFPRHVHGPHAVILHGCAVCLLLPSILMNLVKMHTNKAGAQLIMIKARTRGDLRMSGLQDRGCFCVGTCVDGFD